MISVEEDGDFYLYRPKHIKKNKNQFKSSIKKTKSKYQLQYSACIAGSGGVGKSCITIRFVKNQFDGDYYDPTIEDSYRAVRIIQLGETKKRVTLDLIDTAGQEEFKVVRNGAFVGKDAYILVFDVTVKSTFQELANFHKDIQRYGDNDDYVGIVCANKIDLEEKRVVSKKEAQEFARKRSLMYAEVSAKTGKNIDELFELLMKSIFISKKILKKDDSMSIEQLENRDRQIDGYKTEMRKVRTYSIDITKKKKNFFGFH